MSALPKGLLDVQPVLPLQNSCPFEEGGSLPARDVPGLVPGLRWELALASPPASLPYVPPSTDTEGTQTQSPALLGLKFWLRMVHATHYKS